jgi:hypothetical protein
MYFHSARFLGSIGVRVGETFPGVGTAGWAGLGMADIDTSVLDARLSEKPPLVLIGEKERSALDRGM